jgi:hypothetical protein
MKRGEAEDKINSPDFHNIHIKKMPQNFPTFSHFTSFY